MRSFRFLDKLFPRPHHHNVKSPWTLSCFANGRGRIVFPDRGVLYLIFVFKQEDLKPFYRPIPWPIKPPNGPVCSQNIRNPFDEKPTSTCTCAFPLWSSQFNSLTLVRPPPPWTPFLLLNFPLFPNHRTTLHFHFRPFFTWCFIIDLSYFLGVDQQSLNNLASIRHIFKLPRTLWRQVSCSNKTLDIWTDKLYDKKPLRDEKTWVWLTKNFILSKRTNPKSHFQMLSGAYQIQNWKRELKTVEKLIILNQPNIDKRKYRRIFLLLFFFV